ncbi:hypothetical protein AB0M43_00330 [Longispora sp. NPDC051575]|uniref:hypothetical protein n=1 Tax=Longispora sp. NPDC051575 TaxID=3154943 RepID=UPI00343EB12A
MERSGMDNPHRRRRQIIGLVPAAPGWTALYADVDNKGGVVAEVVAAWALIEGPDGETWIEGVDPSGAGWDGGTCGDITNFTEYVAPGYAPLSLDTITVTNPVRAGDLLSAAASATVGATGRVAFEDLYTALVTANGPADRESVQDLVRDALRLLAEHIDSRRHCTDLPNPTTLPIVTEWLDRTLPADVFDVLVQVAAHHRSA